MNGSYPFLDLLWTMLVLFGFVLWFWLFVVICGDVFGRRNLSGWGKTGWIVLMILFPVLGVLVYLIVNGSGMAERRRAEAEAARSAYESDVRTIAGQHADRSASEIARARELRDSGDLTAEEYEALKRRTLGLPAPGPKATTAG